MSQSYANNNILAGVGNLGDSLMASSPQPLEMNTIPELPHQSANVIKNAARKAYVKIVEQPAGKALRFRYECEGRSAGSIPGANSTSENKTYPTIEIVGYKGRALAVVSCVTKDPPYRPHPHNLVGKEGCKMGVCRLDFNPETMRAVLSNVGIQCVKKKDIEISLKAREEINVDPFKTGFSHRQHLSGIDLNSVRLCFQVLTKSEKTGRCTHPLPPVVSDPIYDKKVKCDLVIYRLCSCSATVLGNTQIILLCEKVAKEDIAVRLFEERNGQTIWEAFGEFQHTDVHKQTAIAFKTPPYRRYDITEPAKVLIQLKRPSDGVTSEALPFEYIPLDSDPVHLKRKRQRTNGEPAFLLLTQEQNQYQNNHQDSRNVKTNGRNATSMPAIKTEPRDTSPQSFAMHRVTPDTTTSPHHPQSPYSTYSHNMVSPYLAAPPPHVAAQSRQPVVSTNQQYSIAGTGGSNNAPLPMDTGNYNTFSQQTLQQQQHYHESNFGNGGGHWETKFSRTAGNNNLSNLQGGNSLMSPNVSGAMGPCPNNASWNLTSNQFHTQHLQEHYPLPHPAQSEVVTTSNPISMANTTGAGTNTNSVINGNHTGHDLTNLLTIDSEQYVHIDSADQQMLRLNSEDLRISDLSITT